MGIQVLGIPTPQDTELVISYGVGDCAALLYTLRGSLRCMLAPSRVHRQQPHALSCADVYEAPCEFNGMRTCGTLAEWFRSQQGEALGAAIARMARICPADCALLARPECRFLSAR